MIRSNMLRTGNEIIIGASALHYFKRKENSNDDICATTDEKAWNFGSCNLGYRRGRIFNRLQLPLPQAIEREVSWSGALKVLLYTSCIGMSLFFLGVTAIITNTTFNCWCERLEVNDCRYANILKLNCRLNIFLIATQVRAYAALVSKIPRPSLVF